MSPDEGIPKVSIGLPVRDGEEFLDEAISSIRKQTFEDFELIICDNASTDRTAEICRAHAASDQRIRYVRNDENIGGSANFEMAFELSRGVYFKWAAHDDVCGPTLIERCVAALDADSSVSMCSSYTAQIDARGRIRHTWPPRPDLSSPRPSRRFREVSREIETYPLWGLARSEMLRGTRLIARYPGSDRALLGELALMGPIVEIPEVLFFHRDHPNRSVHRLDWKKPHLHMRWYEPAPPTRPTFPAWRILGGHLSVVHNACLSPSERLSCYATVARWRLRKRPRHELLDDLKIAVTWYRDRIRAPS